MKKVQIARLIGGNKSYVEQVFPHLAVFLTEQIDRLLDCEVVLIGHPVSEECLQNYMKNGVKVMDLTGTLSRRYNLAIFFYCLMFPSPVHITSLFTLHDLKSNAIRRID